MDKIYVSNHIKLDILNICGQPTVKSYNLEGNTQLSSLGYQYTLHSKALEEHLQKIAIFYNTGKLIPTGIIYDNFTVNECIRMVLR
jgi:hypothetical protein